MRIRITKDIDQRYASSMAKGAGLKTGADYKCFIEQSRRQPSMVGWFAVMDFVAGKWVDVELDFIFDRQFNIGDPPGFVPPEGRNPLSSGARVDLSYVEAIDFSPEFSGPEEYLQAVQKRYDVDWPGSKVSVMLRHSIDQGLIKDETPRKEDGT